VRSGETVELVLGRGGVEVVVRGTAREDGADGDHIYVRNELDGRLVRGRVTGPNRVAWGR
jgi:flagella basal body P-ring formation protein FlgA